MRTGVRSKLTFFISLMVFSLAASAAKWDMKSSVNIRTGYSDNATLRSSDEIASSEGQLSGSTQFSLTTPRSSVSGDIALSLRRYTGTNAPDRNNARVGINSSYNMRKSAVGLNGSFIRDSTLDSQLDETGIGFIDLNRNDSIAGAFWRYNFGLRTRANVNYNYRDVDYEEITGSGFVNFNSHSASLAISQTISPRLSITGTGNYSLSENDNDVTTVNTSVQASSDYEFSDTLSASISIGRRKTTVDFQSNSLIPIIVGNSNPVFIAITQDITNESTGSTYDISITKSFLRGDTQLQVQKGISTSANGVPIEVTNATWSIHYGFSPSVSGDLILRGSQSDIEDVLGRQSTSRSIIFGPKINWKINRLFTIVVDYTLSRYEFSNGADDAVRNAAHLTLRYQ